MIQQAVQKYLQRNDFQKIETKALFFDMDGVLFDSMPHHAIAWVQAMEENDVPFTQYDAYMNEGQKGVDTITYAIKREQKRAASDMDKKRIYDRKGEIFSTMGAPKTIPYALEMVEKIANSGLEVFVVTGSGHKKLLKRLIDTFPMIDKEKVVSAFDVKKGKPHPDPYLKALEMAQLSPHQAIVVENAPLGVQSASSAQIFTIAVNTGPLEDEVLRTSGADVIYDSMQTLYESWDEIKL